MTDTTQAMQVFLRLESGEVFAGNSFGAALPKEGRSGELVFSTGMVGYPESLTDPSFKNQILVMTYPLIGNYGVPQVGDGLGDSSMGELESNRIHLSGLIVGQVSDQYSHWSAVESLSDWLAREGVVGITGVDTRELTKLIRERGVVRARIMSEEQLEKKGIEEIDFSWNDRNLVAQVSTDRVVHLESPLVATSSENPVRILVVDCGLKYNQLRCLLKFPVVLKVVPWNYNLLSEDRNSYDRLFISNGPGDPQDCGALIEQLRLLMARELEQENPIPIFGICLGHQLLSLAAGAKTYKMKYGNRGLNIPCQLVGTQRAVISSQNHGYAVDTETLPSDWAELFVNANDGSNEGIYCTRGPFFSVQFHPEAAPGPQDSEFLFGLFIKNDPIRGRVDNFMDPIRSVMEGGSQFDLSSKRRQRRKVLILGSGGLSIGQSGEFDYSGSQAIKAYREEGLQTVLINPNIATNQTSKGFADKVYFLPLDPDYVLRVIKVERPDCITVSFGGQTALNCGVELYHRGVFEKYGVHVLGTPIEAVIDTEDRDRFKQRLEQVGEQAIESLSANTIEEALAGADQIGYPVLLRAAYALGGLGSGFANDRAELERMLPVAFSCSSQVIIDRSLWGWKELEYEVVRDRYDNCICVCNMENIDPLGIHTGESMVVAPSQTLDDRDFQMLRTSAIRVIRSLGIVGECNIQFALDPASRRYYIIEVNARLSRSSALASKATGYPLAYVAAKLSLDHSLLEVKNSVTRKTCALFEPSMDYCVVKVPRWDLRKFPQVSTKLDSSMKSIGEAMGIARTFEEAFQKALRMADDQCLGFQPGLRQVTDTELSEPTYQRMYSLATGLHSRRYDLERVYSLTRIDRWFLYGMKRIIGMYHRLEQVGEEDQSVIPAGMLLEAKRLGFSDKQISLPANSMELVVKSRRQQCGIVPSVKQIDTVAAEFPCYTNYLFTSYGPVQLCSSSSGDKDAVDSSCYLRSNYHDVDFNHQTVMVLGSGVYKIGSSVEFDWCCVNAVKELRRLGYHTTMINCNPETVSTDYDEADQLYFDELSFEMVMEIYQLEQPRGMILATGGQVANNMAMQLFRQGVQVIGTSPEVIDVAENRYKFSRLLDQLGVQQPKWRELTSIEEAKEFCAQVSYPCLIRPSYVLSGAAMNVCYSDDDLAAYLKCAVDISRDHPVVISKYISDAKEIEVDAVAAGGEIRALAISEHVENAGVHSGDSTIILPAQDVNQRTIGRIERVVEKLVGALEICGPFNMQFIVKDDQVKVIECNLRVSRTFPFVSKTLNVNLISVAIDGMLGLNQYRGRAPTNPHAVGVKVAKFSFSRLKKADFSLGVEMVSTGEVACYGRDRYDAYLKALQATDFQLPPVGGGVLISLGTYRFKEDMVESARRLESMGYKLYGTRGTGDFLSEQGVTISEVLFGMGADDPRGFEHLIGAGKINLIINGSRKGRIEEVNLGGAPSQGYLIRRTAVDNSIPIITDVKCAKLFVKSLMLFHQNDRQVWIDTGVDCMTKYQSIRLPGMVDVHVHMREPGGEHKEDWETGTKSALAGGITTLCAMPNTDPAIVGESELSLVEQLSESKSHCDFGLYVGASSDNYESISKLADRAVALKMYLNNTYGPLLMKDTLIWAKQIKNWPCDDRPLCVHAEAETLAAVLHVANAYNKRIHVCHVSTRQEIELVKLSKEMGMKVTCEVAPHHLFMDVEDLARLGDCGAVKPPLAAADDQQALWENMDVIDCFATDHAPHTPEEKGLLDEAGHRHVPPGFPGLETALPLLLTAVNQGRLTLEQLVEKYHTNPLRIFHLESVVDTENTYIEVDLDREWVIPKVPQFSKAGWTPFAGMKVCGAVRRVVLRGKVVYVDGEILSSPGYGRNVGREVKLSGLLQAVDRTELVESSNGGDSELMASESRSVDSSANYWRGRSLLSVEQLNRNDLRQLFAHADYLRNQPTEALLNRLSGKQISLLFYEPSTRTCSSFSLALKRLGAGVEAINVAGSSVQKGESFKDTMMTLQSYTDAIVARIRPDQTWNQLDGQVRVPVINAGDGLIEHPTQALLDLYTIRRERGTVNGLKIALVGDLKHGRTVHSLVKMLAEYRVELMYISPSWLSMPSDLVKYVSTRGIEQSVHEDLDDIIEEVDILYVTRIQEERMQGVLDVRERNEMMRGYYVTPNKLTRAKDNLVIMHPLPRRGEISPEIDSDPRAAYFRQMENGMWSRMALMDLILKD